MAPAGAVVITLIRRRPQASSITRPCSGSKIASVQAYRFSNQATEASSPTVKGSSRKPSFTRSSILWPGYKRTSLGSGDPATRTNEFFGWRTKKAIWWGDRRTLLTFVNFNSTRKKFPELLYPNISGVPNKALFSSLVQQILLLNLLSSRHKSFSNFTG